MKKIFILIGLIYGVCACSHKSDDEPYNLGPYPSELCSLIVRTQLSPIIERREVSCSLRNELMIRLKDDTLTHTRAVRLYIDGAFASVGGPRPLRKVMLDSALRLVDSVNYPAMMHRIKAELLKLEGPFTKNHYYSVKRELDYFGNIGDTLSMALLEVSLGPSFMGVGCPEEALEVTKKVLNTFERIGQPRFAGRTRINEALYYGELRDTARKDSVYRILLSDTEIQKNSPQFREGIVRNAYIDFKDTTYLKEGWRIVAPDSIPRPAHTAYYAFFADRLLEEHKADSALKMLRTGWKIGENFGFPNLNHRLLLIEGLASTYDMLGNADSALYYYKLYNHINDSIKALESGQEIIRTTYAREIESLKYEQELERNHDRWVWSIIITVLVLLALSSFIWIWKQRQTTLLRLSREQNEMDRTRHELAANILAKQEKDSLLSEMNRHIDRMTTDGHMSHSAASELQTMIRLHETGQKEWEALEELLVKIRPRFMARLHETAPGMTVKYCRMAAYIYVGMSSQQIARLLMIRPMSVYQARWRLRKQLGIPEGEGLEEFLERLGSE